MKVSLVLPAALKEIARGGTRIELEPADGSVGGVLAALRETLPAVYDRLMTEQHELREHVNVFVGSEDIRWSGGLESRVEDGGEVYVLPSVSGGV